MHSTIKLTSENSTASKVSFMEVYRWLQDNIGPRVSWRSVRVTGQGWTIETTSMLHNSLVVNVQDNAKAMLFMLRFGGELVPPEDLDWEWLNS